MLKNKMENIEAKHTKEISKITQKLQGVMAKLDKLDGNGNDEEKKEELDELKDFLTNDKYRVKLPQYYDVFKDEGFEELDVLKELTDKDLMEDLKIAKKAHRIKILRGIKLLNVNENQNNDNNIAAADPHENIAPPAAYVDDMI